MSVKSYQARLVEKLQPLLGEVTMEWKPFLTRDQGYSPRPDIAVGPYAIEDNSEHIHKKLIRKHRYFIRALISKHNENAEHYASQLPIRNFDELTNSNANARCLFCVEIENQVSRKHILGGLVNASALGRVAILVGWDERKVRAMFQQRIYMDFLRRVRKNHFYTENVVILSPQQFEECVDGYIRHRKR